MDHPRWMKYARTTRCHPRTDPTKKGKNYKNPTTGSTKANK